MQKNIHAFIHFYTCLMLLSVLAACAASPTQVISPSASQATPTIPLPTIEAALTAQAALLSSPTPSALPPTPTATFTPTPRPGPSPEEWQQWPVIPVVSAHAREIYARGIARGNNPNAFSKVGDCQNIRQYFLGLFEGFQIKGTGYDDLQPVIDQFPQSYTRKSLAVKTGFNVASVLTSINADPTQCQAGENPMACEYRLWNPSIVIISMETWAKDRPANLYENYMRQILDYTLSKDILPILATKADNLEGDHTINRIIAKLAYEYDIPLWNFWLAVQPLPDKGLLEDGFHLTNGSMNYSDPNTFLKAWPVRNITALQALNAVWLAVKK
jgi:hypothetical protein